MADVSDILDNTLCDYWPASCIFRCIRWRCSREGKCGKLEYYFIGDSYPYFAPPTYKPNDDPDCVCVKSMLNPG